MIKAGVKIGDGAVVGMGAIVTKDIGPYEIWAGNPARLIRKRFDDETIDAFEKMKWWEWDDREIENYSDLFTSPEFFINAAEEEKK